MLESVLKKTVLSRPSLPKGVKDSEEIPANFKQLNEILVEGT